MLDFEPIFYSSCAIAIGSLTAATLALKIYFEIKKIRQIEWMSKINEQWNQFNFFLVNSKSTDLFEKFVSGKKTSRTKNSELNAVIFSYLNIVYTVASARKQNLVQHEFCDKMLSDHYEIIRKNETIVRPLLKKRGYSNFFENEIFSWYKSSSK